MTIFTNIRKESDVNMLATYMHIKMFANDHLEMFANDHLEMFAKRY